MFWRIVICFAILWGVFAFMTSYLEYTYSSDKLSIHFLSYKERIIGSLIFALVSVLVLPLAPILIFLYFFNKYKTNK